MDNLPPELIDRIAGELADDVQSLVALACASRTLHSVIAPDRLRYFAVAANISDTRFWDDLSSNPRHASFVHKLRLLDEREARSKHHVRKTPGPSQDRYRAVSALAKHLPSLTHLDARVFNIGLLLDFFLTLEAYPNRKLVHVNVVTSDDEHVGTPREETMLAVIASLRNLLTLKWTGTMGSTGKILDALMRIRCPNLENLYLAHMNTAEPLLSQNVIPLWRGRWSKLRSLRLYMFDASRCSREIKYFMEYHTNIETFSHTAPANASKQPNLEPGWLPALRHLDLNYAGPRRLAYLFQPAPGGVKRKIESLKINISLCLPHLSSQSSLSFFSDAKCLRKIKVDADLTVRDFGILGIIGSYARNIEEIHFRNTSGVENADIPYVMSAFAAFPCLKKVYTSSMCPIRGNLASRVPVHCWDELSSSCPQILRFGTWIRHTPSSEWTEQQRPSSRRHATNSHHLAQELRELARQPGP